MGLKELLLQRSGNLGNLTETAEVTGKAVSNQSGNLGSPENTEGLEKTGHRGADPENPTHDLLFSEVTKATEVTALKTRAESGNLSAAHEVTEVTRRAPNPPPKGSLVQRLCAAGATVRTWSVGRGGEASIAAPAGIPAELLHEVEARGWRIIPGGKPNAEAAHDSWAFGGVGIRELD